MSRSTNAQLAVDLYESLRQEFGWDNKNAWKGIALMLLSCKVWIAGWTDFYNCVVYRERNDFEDGPNGPNAVLRRGHDLTRYLAAELGIKHSDLCGAIGKYWAIPKLRSLQPNNLVGNAFRSVVCHVLRHYGDSAIQYEEEVSAYEEFPGQSFDTRSKKPKIDIVGRRGKKTVALISARWRFRHDRVDVVRTEIGRHGEKGPHPLSSSPSRTANSVSTRRKISR